MNLPTGKNKPPRLFGSRGLVLKPKGCLFCHNLLTAGFSLVGDMKKINPWRQALQRQGKRRNLRLPLTARLLTLVIQYPCGCLRQFHVAEGAYVSPKYPPPLRIKSNLSGGIFYANNTPAIDCGRLLSQ